MPNCGCFHGFKLAPTPGNNIKLALVLEGIAHLKEIIDRANVVHSISEEPSMFANTYLLTGIYEESQPQDFLKLLDSTIIIDIEPLEDCYALAPYSVFDDVGNAVKTPAGSLLNQAKYWGNKYPQGHGKHRESRCSRLAVIAAGSR